MIFSLLITTKDRFYNPLFVRLRFIDEEVFFTFKCNIVMTKVGSCPMCPSQLSYLFIFALFITDLKFVTVTQWNPSASC